MLHKMKLERMGCCFIYSVALILFGMGLYKYRAEVVDFLTAKYHSTVQYIQEKAPAKANDVKETISDNFK